MEKFDLGKWCDAVNKAAQGVLDPIALPKDRRKWERELMMLTTPGQCLYVVAAICSRENLKTGEMSLTS